MNTITEKFFFILLRIGLENKESNRITLISEVQCIEESGDAIDWKVIFTLGVKQGIAAIMFDGLQCYMKNNARGVSTQLLLLPIGL